MPAELEFLTHFHFLRPAWGLLLLPWLVITWMMGEKETSRDMFGGIIAPHLLEHLRVERFYSPWLNPRRFSQLVLVLLLIVLMGPSWRQQPAPPRPGRRRTQTRCTKFDKSRHHSPGVF